MSAVSQSAICKDLIFSGVVTLASVAAIVVLSLGLSSAQGTVPHYFNAKWIQDMGGFMKTYWPVAVVPIAGLFAPFTIIGVMMFVDAAQHLSMPSWPQRSHTQIKAAHALVKQVQSMITETNEPIPITQSTTNRAEQAKETERALAQKRAALEARTQQLNTTDTDD